LESPPSQQRTPGRDDPLAPFDTKSNSFTPTCIKKGSTVTVVLLTFEVLVVALVADVVLATYPSRHVDH
jgi:hypothetical protein